MASAIEIAREIFPGASDEDLDYAIWGRTGFPYFWPNTDKSPEENLRSQLLEYKQAMARGTRLCDFCCNDAEEGKWTCSEHSKAWREVQETIAKEEAKA